MVVATANLNPTYPAPELLKYMEQQAEIFDRIKPQLIDRFLNQFVWFENGGKRSRG
jgi:hypothetical protein